MRLLFSSEADERNFEPDIWSTAGQQEARAKACAPVSWIFRLAELDHAPFMIEDFLTMTWRSVGYQR